MWSTFALFSVLLLVVRLFSHTQAQVGLFREGFTDILVRGPVRQDNIQWGYNPAYADHQSIPSQHLNEYICDYIRAGFATDAKLQSIPVECTTYKVDPISFEVTTKLRMPNAQLNASQLPTIFGGLNEIVEQMLRQFNSSDRNFVYNAHVLVVGFLHGNFFLQRISPLTVVEEWNNAGSPIYSRMNDDICAVVRLLGQADAQFHQIKYDCEIIRGGVPESLEITTKISILATELERLGLACDSTTVSLLLQNKIAYRAISTTSVFYNPFLSDPELKSDVHYYLLQGRITQHGSPISFYSIHEAKRSNELKTFVNKVCLIIKRNICTRWGMAPNYQCQAELQSYNAGNMMYTTVIKLHPPYFSLFGMMIFAEKLHVALIDLIQTGLLSNERFTYKAQITKPDIMFITITFQLEGRMTPVASVFDPGAIHDEICAKIRRHNELRRLIQPYSSTCSLVQFNSLTSQMRIQLRVSVGQKGYRYMMTNTPLIPSALNDLGTRGAFADTHTGYSYNARVIFPDLHLERAIPTSRNTLLEENTVIINMETINESVSNTADERELFRYVHQSYCSNLLPRVRGNGVPLASVIRCDVLKLDPIGRHVKTRILISHHDMVSMNLTPGDITIE